MPNWVNQDLFVIGPTHDLERFCKAAVTGKFGRNRSRLEEPTFRFDTACPLRGKEKGLDEHRSAVLYRYVHSQSEAYFLLQTSWTYPEHFYGTRLLRDWPSLQFCCAVNEDMGTFGGVIAGIGGRVTDLIETPGDVGKQKRRVTELLREWRALALRDRNWRVELPLKFISRVRYGVDAVFEDEYTNVLYLRSEHDVRRLVRRRTAALVFRRDPRRKWAKVRSLSR